MIILWGDCSHLQKREKLGGWIRQGAIHETPISGILFPHSLSWVEEWAKKPFLTYNTVCIRLEMYVT